MAEDTGAMKLKEVAANKLQTALEDPKSVPAPSEGATPSKATRCPKHQDRELELYCMNCNELMCYLCASTCGSHDKHEYEELYVAFVRYKKKMVSLLENQIVPVKEALALIKQRCGEVSDQEVAIEEKIHVTFRQLREVLTARETELVKQLHQMTQDKLKSLSTKSSQIENTLTRLSSCLDFMRKSVKEEALTMDTAMAEQVRELTTPFQPDAFKPSTNADMIFSALADLMETCKKYGQVSTSATASGPSKLQVKGQVAVQKETSTSAAVLQAKSRTQNSKEPIKTAKKSDAPFLTLGGVKGPRGVAINQSGEVVVSEGVGDCVSVFSPTGKKLRSFGKKGSGLGHFNSPYGLAVDSEGNILVADGLNSRIQKFTANGRFLATVGTPGSGPLQFNLPTDIAFNTNNNKLYVADYGNDRIQVLNSDLTLARTFGKVGCGKGQFSCPFGVACDSTGKVYVTDMHRIQVFTPQGKYVIMFGQEEERVGRPRNVTVDPMGVVYTSEHKNHLISLFTSKGQLSRSFGRKGMGPGEFNHPGGLALDKSGHLYVCDHYNNRIQVF